MAKLLMLGAGRGQLAAYRAARALGLDIVGVDPDPDAPALALARHPVRLDLGDLAALLELARRYRVEGVFTMAADYPMPSLAALCHELGLPGPSPLAVAQATHKARMRAAFARHGVPGPRSHPAATAQQAVALAHELGGDVIIKPALSNGGRGVSRVAAGASDAALEAAFAHAKCHTRADGALVEDFVEGQEFSVESLSWRGQTRVVAVTEKLTSGSPHFVELGHRQPPQWPAPVLQLLADTARAAVRALGIDDAAAHSEMRLTPDGARMMETGARLGGGFICSDLVPLSTGIDLVRAALQVALGHAPDLRPGRVPAGAAIRFLTAEPGRVRQVAGMERARAMEGVEAVDVYVRPGDRVVPLTDATGRCGHVICRAEGAREAARRAAAALACLHVETEGLHR